MITAEKEGSGCSIEETKTIGGLPHKIGSYYNEFLIINYIGESIYAVDYQNKHALIQQHPTLMAKKEIQILYRASLGSDRRYDVYNLDITPNIRRTITIPYDIIRREPVFVEEINAVLCFGDHLSGVKHPHSQKSIDDLLEQTKLETEADATQYPFIILANDPSGRIKSLFFEINDMICETKVSCRSTESDTVLIGYRNKPHSMNDFTTHKTTFTDLLSQDPRVWTFGGFRFSCNRKWFEHVIEVERGKKPTYIEVGAVDALVKQARVEAEDKIRILTEENRDVVARFKRLEATHEALKNGDYHERSAELAHKKLDVEADKLRKAEMEAKLSLDAERVKMKKELLSTLGVLAKTLVVVVPIGIGIYKAIKVARSGKT